MSFSRCIDRGPIFVAVCGTSGIGKTTLVKNLIEKHGDCFSYPKSYTTREGREGDDFYEYVSDEKIRELYDKAQLVNLDFIYGNYYGVSTSSLNSIFSSKKIAIKEIHPNNLCKFERLEVTFIKVQLTLNDVLNEHPANCFVQREGRSAEKFDDEMFDISLNLSGLSKSESVSCFLNRLTCFLANIEYVANSKIDNKNKLGYDKLAPEFNDDKRVTTENFHRASIPFWEKLIEQVSDMSLEVGYGNGWLFSKFPLQNKRVIGVDISRYMSPSYLHSSFVCSARHMPFSSSSFSFVCGSLIDPFLYEEFFLELDRIVKPGGTVAFTYPSIEWVSSFPNRPADELTEFLMSKGEMVEVFSLCIDRSDLLGFTKNTFLEIVHYENFSLGEEALSIAPAVLSAAEKLKVPPGNLNIVTGVILRKAS